MGKVRIGMSGWTYPGWRGTFYPKGWPQARELEFASRRVSSIEINGTFYRLQKPDTFRKWADAVPSGYCFAIKASQFITHVLRAKEVEEVLPNFFASGLFCLGAKLGPILWQFPPYLALKDDRIEQLAKLLPKTSAEAAEIARHHNDKIKGKAQVEPLVEAPMRHAFEFRHPSFRHPDFVAMLREHNIALVTADSGAHSLGIEDITADFVYVRFHGEDEHHKQRAYSPKEIEKWARRVRCWQKGEDPPDLETLIGPPAPADRDVFLYFDNDAKAYAPGNAMQLIKALGLEVPESDRFSAEELSAAGRGKKPKKKAKKAAKKPSNKKKKKTTRKKKR